MQEITKALQTTCGLITEGTTPTDILALSQGALNLAQALGAVEGAEYMRKQNEGATDAA